MASPASVLAVVRAAAPSFRNPHDQLAFAVHAAVLSSGYRLVAVGEQAQLQGLQADAADVPVTGWNNSSEQYTFAYLSEDILPSIAAAGAEPAKLLVKSLVLGDSLLTTLASDKDSIEPRVLDMPVSDYVMTGEKAAAGSSAAKTYKNLDQLTNLLNTAVSDVAGMTTAAAGDSGSQKKQKTGGAAAAAATVEGGSSSSERAGARPSQPDVDHEYDPLRIGPERRPPLRVGHEDIMPILGGGAGVGGVGGVGGGVLPGGPPLHGPTGGGMHVGPGHPFFADRMRHPDLMPGRGLGGGGMPGGPGGIRWDPINPEGLEGWRPEDFQRPQPGLMGPGRGGGGGGRGFHPDIDPDIGQPGPGRGADWDNMFG